MAADGQELSASVRIPECPICEKQLSAPIFLCPSGHSLCVWCTVCPSICPICLRAVTRTRNRVLEELIRNVTTACPNRARGCTYSVRSDAVDAHAAECLFRPRECPHVAFGDCPCNGLKKRTEHSEKKLPGDCAPPTEHSENKHPDDCAPRTEHSEKTHPVDFAPQTEHSEKHPDDCAPRTEHSENKHPGDCTPHANADDGWLMEISEVELKDFARHVYLVEHRNSVFVITFKVDTTQGMAYWAILQVGRKSAAQKHFYEIHINGKGEPGRRPEFTTARTPIYNDTMTENELFKQRNCVSLSISFLTRFINNRQLTFHITIKRCSEFRAPRPKPRPGQRRPGSKKFT